MRTAKRGYLYKQQDVLLLLNRGYCIGYHVQTETDCRNSCTNYYNNTKVHKNHNKCDNDIVLLLITR